MRRRRDRWIRANEGEYEEVLKRFKRSVDIKKIKDRNEFQKKVTDWAKLKRGQGKRLSDAFIEILTPPVRKRVMRRIPVEEIIPRRMKKRKEWERHEIAILRYEKRRGRGYAKRVATRLDYERSLKSVYMKAGRI